MMKKSLLFVITLLSSFVTTSMFGMITVATRMSRQGIQTNRPIPKAFSSSPHPEKYYEHLSKMEDSRLTQEAKKCRKAWFFKSKKEEALDSLEEDLKDLADTGGNIDTPWWIQILPNQFTEGFKLAVAATKTEMRDNAIKIILSKDSDNVKKEESKKYIDFAHKYRNQWLERKQLASQLKKQLEEAAKKNSKF